MGFNSAFTVLNSVLDEASGSFQVPAALSPKRNSIFIEEEAGCVSEDSLATGKNLPTFRKNLPRPTSTLKIETIGCS